MCSYTYPFSSIATDEDVLFYWSIISAKWEEKEEWLSSSLVRLPVLLPITCFHTPFDFCTVFFWACLYISIIDLANENPQTLTHRSISIRSKICGRLLQIGWGSTWLTGQHESRSKEVRCVEVIAVCVYSFRVRMRWHIHGDCEILTFDCY